MQIQRVTTELDPATLQPGRVTVTVELEPGMSVQQVVGLIQSAGQAPAPTSTPATRPDPASPPPAKRPGLDPAAALAAYDALSPEAPKVPPKRASIPKIWAGRDGYPDSPVIQQGVSQQHPGKIVLILQDGSKVLAKDQDGVLVEVQRKPSERAEARRAARDELYAAGEVEVVPTSAMSGKLAPPPGGDPPDVPHPEVTRDGLVMGVSAEVREAPTVTKAAQAALEHPNLWREDGADDREAFIAWGQRVKPHVPAFARVAPARFASRLGSIYDREQG